MKTARLSPLNIIGDNGSGSPDEARLSSITRRVLIVVFCTAIGHGIVFAFGLDKAVAALIRAAMIPQSLQFISWILAGTIGLIGLFLWETIYDWVKSREIKPDMQINDAIDYIVNDSAAKLRQPSPPRLIEHGQAAGRMLIEKGVEHEDARAKLNSELISGKVRCWGRRQITNVSPMRFEDSVREIDKITWDQLQLSFVSCLFHTETAPQTAAIPGKKQTAEWTALRVSRYQIEKIWRPKSWLWRVITRRQRIAALPDWQS
jgi:hypothetical protein